MHLLFHIGKILSYSFYNITIYLLLASYQWNLSLGAILSIMSQLSARLSNVKKNLQ